MTSSKLVEKVKSQCSLCILCEVRIEHWLSISLKLQSFRLWHIKAFQRVATCYIPPLPCPRSESHNSLVVRERYENRSKNGRNRFLLRMTAKRKSTQWERFNYRMWDLLSVANRQAIICRCSIFTSLIISNNSF